VTVTNAGASVNFVITVGATVGAAVCCVIIGDGAIVGFLTTEGVFDAARVGFTEGFTDGPATITVIVGFAEVKTLSVVGSAVGTADTSSVPVEALGSAVGCTDHPLSSAVGSHVP